MATASDTAAEETPVEPSKPEFQASDLDIVPSGTQISRFSVFDETCEPLDDGHCAAIEDALAAFAANGYCAGFVVLDLHTGEGVGYNVDTDFFSASTIKAPFVTFLWEEFIDGGRAETSDTLVKGKVYGGTGIMASQDKQEYSLEEVIANTIMYSDNTGYAMLRNNYDGKSWDAWTTQAGVPQAESSAGWYPFYSALDLAKYWIAIDSYLEAGGEGAESLKSVFGSTEVSFIRTAVGSHSEVYAKPGFQFDAPGGYVGAINEAGIVSGPSGEYLISIMSDGDYSYPDMTENAYLMVDLATALDGVHADVLAQ